jgi:hypothetical protein
MNENNHAILSAGLRTVSEQTVERRFKLFKDLETHSNKEWLAHHFLGVGEQSVIFGKPGDGKSAVAQDFGMNVSAGWRWFGRKVKQCAVLYVALERRQLVERRAIAFRLHHDIDNLPFAIVGGVHDLRDPKAAMWISDVAAEVSDETGHQVGLIQIDTLSRGLCGGDENSPKDMGAIVKTSGILQAKTGAHIQWLHHTPLDGPERLRGHGALLGAMDTTIHVVKAGDVRTGTVVKANDSEEGERVTFALKSVVIGHNEDGDTTAPVVIPADAQPIGESIPRLTKNQQTLFQILHAAGERGLTLDDWNAKAREAGLGTNRRADLHDWREALKSKGLVYEHNNGWAAKE